MSSISELSVLETWVVIWSLGNEFWVEIFLLVDVVAEVDIVNLSDVSLVKVVSNEDHEEVLGRWEDVHVLQHSSELLSSDMAALGSVIILELWLDQDSVVLDLLSD